MGEAVVDPDRRDDLTEPLTVRLLPGDRQREEDVLLRGERRDEVEGLEDEPDPAAAQHREVAVVECAQFGVADEDPAFGEIVEPGEAMQQCGLAGTRRPHDRGELAAAEGNGHVVEGAHGRFALSIDLGPVLDPGRSQAQVRRG